MGPTDLAYTESELRQIADLLKSELDPSKRQINRYFRRIRLSKEFYDGRTESQNITCSHTNLEDMTDGTFSSTHLIGSLNRNFNAIRAKREFEKQSFPFQDKQVPLPTDNPKDIEPIPSDITFYDKRFLDFTMGHPGTALTRTLDIIQQVIVNSKGGMAIRSTPIFTIQYQNDFPLKTTRQIAAVCASAEDIQNLTRLIEYLPDPTPEHRIKSATSWEEAFHILYQISGLAYGTLEEAGITGTHADVVSCNGLFWHEVLGHHFEEPLHQLNRNQPSPILQPRNLKNTDLCIEDNPHFILPGNHTARHRSNSSDHFDAYGRKTKPTKHLGQGKMHDYLGSEYGDEKGLSDLRGTREEPFTGNAVQGENGFLPRARMSCTVARGTPQEVDLEGKLVIVGNNGATNPATMFYAIHANECYIIRDGIPRRLPPIKITKGIYDALENVILLPGKTYTSATCYVNEPIEGKHSSGVPVSQFGNDHLLPQQQIIPVRLTENQIRLLRQQ